MTTMTSTSDRARTGPARTTQVAAALLAGPAAVAVAVGAALVPTMRLTWVGLPLLLAGLATAAAVRWAWRDPGRRAAVTGLLLVDAGWILAVVTWLRMRRPLDHTLALALGLLAVLLVVVALSAWSRLRAIGWTPPAGPASRVALVLSGGVLVVVGTMAPVIDQPPFTPLELAARAVVDQECGRFHVDDPRGMGSLGFVSSEAAPPHWERRRGTLVLSFEPGATFVADGRAYRLEPGNGLSPCP